VRPLWRGPAGKSGEKNIVRMARGPLWVGGGEMGTNNETVKSATLKSLAHHLATNGFAGLGPVEKKVGNWEDRPGQLMTKPSLGR